VKKGEGNVNGGRGPPTAGVAQSSVTGKTNLSSTENTLPNNGVIGNRQTDTEEGGGGCVHTGTKGAVLCGGVFRVTGGGEGTVL